MQSGVLASPTCTYCSLSEEETPWHHVAICPGFKTARKLRLGKVKTWTWANLTNNHLRSLAGYLKDAKRLENFNDM